MSSRSGSSRCCLRNLGIAVTPSATTGWLWRASRTGRTGIPRRDLPRDQFGPWQTVWKRHRLYAGDGTWDRVLMRIPGDADAAGKINWVVPIEATIARAHQHRTSITRPKQDTGGGIES